jgi:hypothetical protein
LTAAVAVYAASLATAGFLVNGRQAVIDRSDLRAEVTLEQGRGGVNQNIQVRFYKAGRRPVRVEEAGMWSDKSTTARYPYWTGLGHGQGDTLHSFALQQLMRNSVDLQRSGGTVRVADDWEERNLVLADLKRWLDLPDIATAWENVMTMHRAKGLTAGCTIVAAAEDELVPGRGEVRRGAPAPLRLAYAGK